MNKIIVTVLIVLLVGIAFIAGYVLNSHSSVISGNAILNGQDYPSKYSWTTALCDSNHYCMDIYVECSGKTILNVTPMSDIISFNANWEDPRMQNNELCPHM